MDDFEPQVRRELDRIQQVVHEATEEARLAAEKLERGRQELDALTVIARIRGYDLAQQPTEPAVSPEIRRVDPPPAAGRPGPSTRKRIRNLLFDFGGPMQMSDIVDQIRAQGSPAQPDTIRSLLHKMKEAGEIDRVSHGMYQAPPNVSPLARETLDGRAWLFEADGPSDQEPGTDLAATVRPQSVETRS